MCRKSIEKQSKLSNFQGFELESDEKRHDARELRKALHIVSLLVLKGKLYFAILRLLAKRKNKAR